ncbi:MAG TPA: HDIG domain-containing protein [Clostridiaceae bacterium]|nr:HDIG domain-containing protein [Clostridiaceae bacterium]
MSLSAINKNRNKKLVKNDKGKVWLSENIDGRNIKINKNKGYIVRLKEFIGSFKFQKLIISILTIIIAFVIILNGALPKRYKLTIGMPSPYDIIAPRDIENKVLTEQRALEAAKNVPPEVIRKINVPVEVLNSVDSFFTFIETSREKVAQIADSASNVETGNNPTQSEIPEDEINKILDELKRNVNTLNLLVPISNEQYNYLINKISEEDMAVFKKTFKELISEVMTQEITVENIALKIDAASGNLQNTDFEQELKNLGAHLLKAFIRTNSEIDEELTEQKRKAVYESVLENNKVMVKKNSRIISVQEIVTEDKMKMLEELNLIETEKIDYVFALGIAILVLILFSIFLLCTKIYCRNVLTNKNYILVLSIIVTISLLAARILKEYSPLYIPFLIAPMLIAILIDLKLAIIVNFLLTLAVSIMTNGDMLYLYMALASGIFAAFMVNRSSQRSSLSISGTIAALINVIVVSCFGIINKSQLKTIALDSLIVIANGLISTIITIGMLPFWEITFNLITPLKLMELSNPNQALLKKLMIEAPGTYHHSLMVGNLAEVAAENLGANALLARVGAYYHDVGKLKRPDFFGENQISGNPHDKMTPSLSTLVIISHVQDGVKIAEKYKLPNAIKDIIMQHHGTTLVAYFYHKAKKGDKNNLIKEEDYRYPGPKPLSKEAAVVMLADSVEAAVRSMTEKTEGKIEGLIRKIIKDKLDDGQFDLTDLTLKDLDIIANSFAKVFSGFFHAREKYPEIAKDSDGLKDYGDFLYNNEGSEIKNSSANNYSGNSNNKNESNTNTDEVCSITINK